MTDFRNPSINNKQPSYQKDTTQSLIPLNSSAQLLKQCIPITKTNEEIRINEYLGKGVTAEVFSIQNYDNAVLKLFYENVNPTKISAEYQKTKAIAQIIVNTPKVHNILTINGRHGIIMEKAQGETLKDYLIKCPEMATQIMEVLGKTQASIHNHSYDNLPSQKEFYKFFIECYYGSQKKEILQIFDQLPEGSRICHNDFSLDNVFITNTTLNNGLINETQIIDWAMATKGNPIGDFAKTLVTLQCSASELEMTSEMRKNKRNLINKLVKTYVGSVDFPVSQEELDKWRTVTSAMMVTMLSHVKESKTDLAEKNQLDISIDNYRNLIDKLLEKYQ